MTLEAEQAKFPGVLKDDVDESRGLGDECDREESPKCQLERGIRHSAFGIQIQIRYSNSLTDFCPAHLSHSILRL
jgi:hypothetical protein